MTTETFKLIRTYTARSTPGFVYELGGRRCASLARSLDHLKARLAVSMDLLKANPMDELIRVKSGGQPYTQAELIKIADSAKADFLEEWVYDEDGDADLMSLCLLKVIETKDRQWWIDSEQAIGQDPYEALLGEGYDHTTFVRLGLCTQAELDAYNAAA